jgi:hypothetical protein
VAVCLRWVSIAGGHARSDASSRKNCRSQRAAKISSPSTMVRVCRTHLRHRRSRRCAAARFSAFRRPVSRSAGSSGTIGHTREKHLAQLDHGIGRELVKSFEIKSGFQEVCTTFHVETQPFGKPDSQLVEQSLLLGCWLGDASQSNLVTVWLWAKRYQRCAAVIAGPKPDPE